MDCWGFGCSELTRSLCEHTTKCTVTRFGDHQDVYTHGSSKETHTLPGTQGHARGYGANAHKHDKQLREISIMTIHLPLHTVPETALSYETTEFVVLLRANRAHTPVFGVSLVHESENAEHDAVFRHSAQHSAGSVDATDRRGVRTNSMFEKNTHPESGQPACVVIKTCERASV